MILTPSVTANTDTTVVCVQFPGRTFHEEWHEGDDGRLHLGDGEPVHAVVTRRVHQRLEVRKHLLELPWQFLEIK